MRDYSKLKARAELDEMCNERFTNIAPSDLLELIEENVRLNSERDEFMESQGRRMDTLRVEHMANIENIKADRAACWEEFKSQGRLMDRLKAENEALKHAVSAGAARELDLRSQVRNANESRARVVQSNKRLRSEREELRVDAERFRYIQQDADSGMRRIYGDDWVSVIDANGFQK